MAGLVLVGLLAPFSPLSPFNNDGKESSGPAAGAGDDSAADQTPAPVAPVLQLPPMELAAAPGAARLQSEQLLGEHAALLSRSTRAALQDDPESVLATDAALSANVEDLGRLVEQWAGVDAAGAFEALWTRHADAVAAYAAAVHSVDEPAAEQARAEAAAVVSELDEMLAVAAPPAQDGMGAALQEHMARQLEHVDAFAAEDYPAAYTAARNAHTQAFAAGTHLARAVTAREAPLPAEFASPDRELQSRLGLLLGEHADLTVQLTRSGLADSPDFPAVADALNANSAELAAVVAGVFGSEAGAAYSQLWAQHIDGVVAYARAIAADDTGGARQAMDELHQSSEAAAAYFEAQTGGRLSAADTAPVFERHHMSLSEQVDGYQRGDLGAATEAAFAAYRGSFVLAAAAGPAIAATVAAQAPAGGVQTGLGGAASDVVNR